ncbi:hypothetical protein [Hydrogenophaga sp. SL48]|uniref:hypothetical protein n=1 Tax=Hydrogenophaga sp. SL48 TaxID=2806347 RepID=UPI001F1FF70F|nr:hypothetical protein [Hydrogenophaga sp. SL48]UJW82704.1 hypothetical protein IM738_08505 [Hydrogenophaga sp. SL48]
MAKVLLLVIAAGAGAIATLALVQEGWNLGSIVFLLVAATALWGAVSSSSAVRQFITDLFSG